MEYNANSAVFPDTGENSNSTVVSDMGANSSSTVYIPTLHELNLAAVYRRIPLLVFLAIISLTGTIGNSLVYHVYSSNHRLSNTQCFIMWLAVIDLLSCSIFIPIQIYTQVIVYEFEHAWLCKISRLFNTWAAVSASALLLFIATERFRKVCRPLGWQIKIHVTKYLAALSILIGLLFAWPALFLYGKKTIEITNFKYNLTGTQCSTDDTMANSTLLLVNEVFQGGLFAFGLVYLSIMYILIGHKTRLHSKKISTMSSTLERYVSTVATHESGSNTHNEHRNTSSANDIVQAKPEHTSSPAQVTNNSIRTTYKKDDKLPLTKDNEVKADHSHEDENNIDIHNDNGPSSAADNAFFPDDIGVNDEPSDESQTLLCLEQNDELDRSSEKLLPDDTENSKDIQPRTSIDGLEKCTEHDSESENLSCDNIRDNATKYETNASKHDINDCGFIEPQTLKSCLDKRGGETDTISTQAQATENSASIDTNANTLRYIGNHSLSRENSTHSDDTGDNATKHDTNASEHDINVCGSVEPQMLKSCLDTHEGETDTIATQDHATEDNTFIDINDTNLRDMGTQRLSRENSTHSDKSDISVKSTRSVISRVLTIRNIFSLKRDQQASMTTTQHRNVTRDRKMTVQMCAISIGFVLSYMPHVLLMIIRAVQSGFVEGLSDGERVAYNFFLDSYFLNCAINPVIYGVCDIRFRRALRDIFSRCYNRDQS